jgi:hypothetical protein
VVWWVDGVSSASVSSLGLVFSSILIPILFSGRDFKRLVTFLLAMETVSVCCSLAEAIRVSSFKFVGTNVMILKIFLLKKLSTI